ncbi:MAG: ABC transporter ATP-binding protein [Phyllobacteriaceae bacterium]|nr:ABC transporter ATP-binding protein [Phyllobacteriaceae bacterium]MBA90966.1 ABC transporter ATP-binding protein [Phyllobacteriaceae bacterium]
MADPVLQLSGVTRSFGALVASDKVDLDLVSGEIHALIGPNGAGKTTLIKQVVGEILPDAGTIRFHGEDITQAPPARRALAGLARTFQISALAPEFSALENVMVAVAPRAGGVFHFFRSAQRDSALVQPAMAALRRAGLENRAHVPVTGLSHGERRQLEIAIALAMQPKVFLMDEPMAGMGPDGSQRLTRLLSELKAEAPILLVEHDMDAVFALADRISVMVYGRIVATGTADEIRTNALVREAYLGDAA